MNCRSFLRARVPSLLWLVPAFGLVVAAGCGGADNPAGLPVTLTPGGTGSTGGTSLFASRSYNSTVALGTNRSGAVALQVGADGQTVTGTLTVTDTSARTTRQTQSFSFGVGTYSIRGTVNPQTGAFEITGGEGQYAFAMRGTLPTTTSEGAYTLTAGGETYSATLPRVGATPTPGTTPTPGSGSAGQGGTQSITFTNNTSNIDTAPFANAKIVGGSAKTESSSVSASLVVSPPSGSTSIAGTGGFVISATKINGTLTTGSYRVNDYAAGAIVVVGLTQYTGTGSAIEDRILTASSGSVEIVALSSTQVTFRLTNLVLDTRLPATSKASGSVTVTGEITANLTQ